MRWLKLFADVMNSDPGAGGGGGGAPAPAPAVPAAPKVADPEYFSRDYVQILREEAKGNRIKVQGYETENSELKQKLSAAEKIADEKIQAANKAAEQRIMRAELKAIAIKEGLIDPDILALVDLTSVKFDDKGNLVGADELLTTLKESKPYAFGSANTSSTQGKPPKPAGNENFDARNASDADYQREKQKVTGVRR